MISDPVRLGLVGLGRGFALTAPAILQNDNVLPVAAAAPGDASRASFERDFSARTYDDIDGLLDDSEVEAVYIATPHQMHRDHVVAAARAGKHVLVDKPISISLEDAADMVEACKSAGVHLIVGPSHSFDGPVALAAQTLQSGRLGNVRMVHALNCTDFLYRPRRPEELNTDQGGGVIFSQAIHQIDIIRLLCGGKTRSVTAMTGEWDPKRPTEGAYSALLSFENGAFASLTYSGYGHFDSDIWQYNVDEIGRDKLPGCYGAARRNLGTSTSPEEETALKKKRAYQSRDDFPQAQHHEHFGPIIVFCEQGDIRLTPDGIEIFEDFERHIIPAPFNGTRSEVFDALHAAMRHNKTPPQTGAWGMASLEVCHAILTSARTNTTISFANHPGVFP